LKLIAAGKLALMSKFDGAVAKESSELLYACILIWLLLVDVIQMKGPLPFLLHSWQSSELLYACFLSTAFVSVNNKNSFRAQAFVA
jgi:hypothetical protein